VRSGIVARVEMTCCCAAFAADEVAAATTAIAHADPITSKRANVLKEDPTTRTSGDRSRGSGRWA
jgi:hypothetical protein